MIGYTLAYLVVMVSSVYPMLETLMACINVRTSGRSLASSASFALHDIGSYKGRIGGDLAFLLIKGTRRMKRWSLVRSAMDGRVCVDLIGVPSLPTAVSAMRIYRTERGLSTPFQWNQRGTPHRRELKRLND